MSDRSVDPMSYVDHVLVRLPYSKGKIVSITLRSDGYIVRRQSSYGDTLQTYDRDLKETAESIKANALRMTEHKGNADQRAMREANARRARGTQ